MVTLDQQQKLKYSLPNIDSPSTHLPLLSVVHNFGCYWLYNHRSDDQKLPHTDCAWQVVRYSNLNVKKIKNFRDAQNRHL